MVALQLPGCTVTVKLSPYYYPTQLKSAPLVAKMFLLIPPVRPKNRTYGSRGPTISQIRLNTKNVREFPEILMFCGCLSLFAEICRSTFVTVECRWF